MDGLRVVRAQASGQAGEQLVREAGYLVDQARELALAEHDELHRRDGRDRRVARRPVEQCEVAEEVAGPERRDLLTVTGDLGVALDDHEELGPGRALAHEDLAGVDADVLGPPGHEAQILLGAGREQRDLGQVVNERIALRHAGESSHGVNLVPCAGPVAKRLPEAPPGE